IWDDITMILGTFGQALQGFSLTVYDEFRAPVPLPYNLWALCPGLQITIPSATSWRLEQFEMDIGWLALQQKLKIFDEDNLKTAYRFFDHIQRKGPCLKDRYGEDMESEPAKGFMLWIQEAITSIDVIETYIDFEGEFSADSELEAEFTSSEGEYDYPSGDSESDQFADYDYLWWDNEWMDRWWQSLTWMPLTATSIPDVITRAVDRMPIELWSLILLSAVHNSLLPSSDKSLLASIRAFNNHLEIFRETYETYGRLQLVCSEDPSFIPFSAVRVDIGNEETFVSELPGSLFSLEYAESKKLRYRVEYPAVEALAFMDNPDYCANLNLFPNLQLLSTVYLDPDHVLSTFPTLFINLTHLQVPRIYAAKDQTVEGDLAFPHLHTLNIDITAQFVYRGKGPMTSWWVNPGNTLDCLNWSLPSLINLGFRGVDQARYSDIEDLLEKFGLVLKGLDLLSRFDRVACVIDESDASSWRVDSFEMDTSWSMIQERLEDFSRESLEMAFNFFDQIRQDGPYLEDRHGEGMDSAAGQAFMNSLKTITEMKLTKKSPKEDLADDPEAEFTDSEDEDPSNEGGYGEDVEKVDYSYFLEGDCLRHWNDPHRDDNDEDYCPEDESCESE
ncbi:12325_t:CDS:2, partial [Acaulospora colombiana]